MFNIVSPRKALFFHTVHKNVHKKANLCYTAYMRKPYYLVKRSGSPYYQVRLLDPQNPDRYRQVSLRSLQEKLGGEFLSLSPTSKAVSDHIVREYLSRFGVGVSEEAIIYLEKFWSDDSDYVRTARERGRALSERYVRENKQAVSRFKNYLITLKRADITVMDITPGLLERFLLWLRDDGLSPRRCNAILQSVTVPLSHYWHARGMPDRAPGRLVKKLPEKPGARDIFTPEEVRNLFSSLEPWGGDVRYMAANLLAAVTGMRRGEVQGLLIDDVHDDYIDVVHNWQDGKLKEPKWGSARRVPLPANVAALLQDIYTQNPWGNRFVFYGQDREKPIGGRTLLLALQGALRAIGIPQDEIRTRRLTFHTWRHWYNSMMRGRLKDHELRRLTGHSNEEMTERYTQVQLTDEQRRAVSELARLIGTFDDM